MKRDRIIFITVVTYLIAMIVMFFSISNYIMKKDHRLNMEIHNNIRDVLGGKEKIIDVYYSGNKVSYEKAKIPSYKIIDEINTISNQITGSHTRVMDAESEYGDLDKLYRLNYSDTDSRSFLNKDNGWALRSLECNWDGIESRLYFPYAVGHIKQNYDYGDYFSVENAVENAFNFFTTNKESLFADEFKNGSYDEVWNKILEFENKYYYIEEDSFSRLETIGTPLFEEYPEKFDENKKRKFPIKYTYVENGLYRVFIGATQPKTWTIKKRPWNPDMLERKNLWVKWGIGLTIVMLLIVIPLGFKEIKIRKLKNESQYEKLKRLCNPANFLTNYDKDKLDKANFIYQKLITINPEDNQLFKEIQSLAVEQLGISLIDLEKVRELKDKINPKNFMNPYDSEKVALANELYSILGKSDLTFDEFVEVEEQSKKLYNFN